MADTVKRALDMVSRYQDPAAGNKLDQFQWRPLPKVHEKLEGLPEIPSYVENFGGFMDEMARRAINGQMTPRDLIKAYMITRSSIRRQAIRNKTLRLNGGFHLPFSDETKIRPEGAMAEWLMTPMGQRYLDMAERGKVDEEAVADAQVKMKPFGFQDSTEGQAMPWAALNLPQRHKEFSALIADGLSKDPNLPAWRKSSMSLHGIKEAKSGFMGSLLGRGDQPTLDARQIILQTGLPNKEGAARMSNTGFSGVDRLAARQAALNPRLDPALEPFRQHLTHHAIWDKAGNSVTTHEDLMRAMRHAADGGRIGYSRGGRNSPALMALMDHPLGPTFMKVFGIDPAGGSAHVQKALQKIEERKSQIVDPETLDQINDPIERARRQKIVNSYNVDIGANKKLTGGYYNIKQEMAPKDVQANIVGIPGVYPKQRIQSSWRDALTPFKGGTLIGLAGDRSRLGRMTHINGKKLAWDVDLHAGHDYMLEPNKGAVWGNSLNHTAGIDRMIAMAAERGPIIGSFQAMGPQSVDSSHNMVDALLAQIPSSGISEKDAKAFDDALKAGLHAPNKEDRGAFAKAMHGWPGILNSKAASDFMRPENGFLGTHRSAFVKLMDKKDRRDEGFPDVGVTRVAITNPDLLDAPNNTAGHRLVELDPDELMRQAKAARGFRHSTYQGDTGGRYLADVPALPRHEVFAEHALGLMHKDIKGGQVAHPYSLGVEGRNTYRKMTENQQPFAPIEDDLLERVGRSTGGTVQPTEAQKAAGNYKKDHISFQGLPISIETRKGHMRTGPGWQVRVPYDYGYIKRTEGADGDHVDVCIGPDHQSDHVFIVDQHDHQTGQFDEHKVMLGYRTREDARRAYCAGFSDGKGPDRMKNMVRMTMREFKTWLKLLNTKKPTKGQSHIDRALEVASVYHKRHDRDAG